MRRPAVVGALSVGAVPMTCCAIVSIGVRAAQASAMATKRIRVASVKVPTGWFSVSERSLSWYSAAASGALLNKRNSAVSAREKIASRSAGRSVTWLCHAVTNSIGSRLRRGEPPKDTFGISAGLGAQAAGMPHDDRVPLGTSPRWIACANVSATKRFASSSRLSPTVINSFMKAG